MSSSPYKAILKKLIWDEGYPLCLESKPTFNFFLNKGRALSHCNRFGAEITLKPENLAEHHYWVELYALAIYKDYVMVDPTEEREAELLDIITMSITHDFPEIETTDVPTPIKRSSQIINDAYEKYEREVTEKLEVESDLPDLAKLITDFNANSNLVSEIVNLADRISAVVYCVEECVAGNRNLLPALGRYYFRIQAELERFDKKDVNYPVWYINVNTDLLNWACSRVDCESF
jgi:5'-deoxynucleotidase YfbR-like HD superfamily hydrolase